MLHKSEALFTKAQNVIPGGVNSPVRSFLSVGGTPRFIARGEGAYLIDADENKYIDFIGSWGACILGHAHPEITQTLQETLIHGTSFGAPTELEIKLAEKIIQHVPSIEMVRMVSSGTEATMTALRLARAISKKSKIIKFEGCYHGHHDSLLVKTGSGGLTLGLPNSAGVSQAAVGDTLLAAFNDLVQVEALFAAHPNDIAGIIVEPVAGNMGCILPQPGFLEGLRALCTQHHAVLIFDEVMTGFRVGLGGVQQHYNVMPDLTCLAKVIGGGLPVGAIGGPRHLMEYLAPVGPVYQAGTLSGNPLAMAAGLRALEVLERPGVFDALSEKTAQFVQSLNEIAQTLNIPIATCHIGAMFGIFFQETLPTTLSEVSAEHVEKFKKFFHAMLEAGVYCPPSAYEAYFMSTAHMDADLEKARQGFAKNFR